MKVEINHIHEVLPCIKNHKEFIHVVKYGYYQVIDYVYASNEIFKSPKEEGISDNEKKMRMIQLQCRGLKFDMNGMIIGRPFHKFKNYGEDGHISNLYDWNSPHSIMLKLDGSMVHSCLINNQIRLCTRMGITEQSQLAENYLSVRQRNWLETMARMGFTVILEFTSPFNRIVIEYNEPKLTLLAVRNNVSGEYLWQPKYLEGVFDFVETYDFKITNEGIEKLREDTKGIEGYVVSWADGTYVKIKGDEYTQMHRAVSYFEREDMILPIILDSQCDDLYPNLSPENTQRLMDFEAEVLKKYNEYVHLVEYTTNHSRELQQTRKEFALMINSGKFPDGLQSAFFNALDGKDYKQTIKNCIMKNPDKLLDVRW